MDADPPYFMKALPCFYKAAAACELSVHERCKGLATVRQGQLTVTSFCDISICTSL